MSMFVERAPLTCQISRPAVLCVWFQSYIRRSSVSFPGTRATKEDGQILHPSAPMRKRTSFQDNSTNTRRHRPVAAIAGLSHRNALDSLDSHVI